MNTSKPAKNKTTSVSETHEEIESSTSSEAFTSVEKKIQSFLVVLLVAFSALTLYSIHKVGYLFLFQYQFSNPAGWQVLADATVALILINIWMIIDAKKNGRKVWFYVILTIFVGSISPIIYILSRKSTR